MLASAARYREVVGTDDAERYSRIYLVAKEVVGREGLEPPLAF
jgi:hypothetical protein